MTTKTQLFREQPLLNPPKPDEQQWCRPTDADIRAINQVAGWYKDEGKHYAVMKYRGYLAMLGVPVDLPEDEVREYKKFFDVSWHEGKWSNLAELYSFALSLGLAEKIPKEDEAKILEGFQNAREKAEDDSTLIEYHMFMLDIGLPQRLTPQEGERFKKNLERYRKEGLVGSLAMCHAVLKHLGTRYEMPPEDVRIMRESLECERANDIPKEFAHLLYLISRAVRTEQKEETTPLPPLKKI